MSVVKQNYRRSRSAHNPYTQGDACSIARIGCFIRILSIIGALVVIPAGITSPACAVGIVGVSGIVSSAWIISAAGVVGIVRIIGVSRTTRAARLCGRLGGVVGDDGGFCRLGRDILVVPVAHYHVPNRIFANLSGCGNSGEVRYLLRKTVQHFAAVSRSRCHRLLLLAVIGPGFRNRGSVNGLILFYYQHRSALYLIITVLRGCGVGILSHAVLRYFSI